MLYHFSDQPGITIFAPRSIEAWPTPVVWAIDSTRQCNYLLPRDCPRVTFHAAPTTTVDDRDCFLGSAAAVVAIESAWEERVRTAHMYRYLMEPDGFECIDGTAGYYVSERPTKVLAMEKLEDLPSHIIAVGAELRILPTLWPLHDSIIASTLQYSMIRMRNATQSFHHRGSKIRIRPYRSADAAALLALFRDSIRRVASRDYDAEQIAAWASEEIALTAWAARFEGRYAIVAEVDGQLAGFTELEPDGHVDRFYVSADHQRQGVGRALVESLLAEAGRVQISRFFLEASITAKPFFESHGFSVIAPQRVVARGVEFVNYRMERQLS